MVSDGASVNSGIRNSLIWIFERDKPWVVFIWCLTDRLELSWKDVSKTWRKPVDVCLKNLYYLHEKSSKRLRELKELFKILQYVSEFYNN